MPIVPARNLKPDERLLRDLAALRKLQQLLQISMLLDGQLESGCKPCITGAFQLPRALLLQIEFAHDH